VIETARLFFVDKFLDNDIFEKERLSNIARFGYLYRARQKAGRPD
jgi:hypothetical protein